jgi:hypothetical protein
MSTGIKRAMNLALGHFIAKRLGIPRPVHAAELTAIRSAVQNRFDEATAGVTAVDVDGGWTADESLEQHGMRVAMDMMMMEDVQPTDRCGADHAHVRAGLPRCPCRTTD